VDAAYVDKNGDHVDKQGDHVDQQADHVDVSCLITCWSTG
jgi:hypothetical protein